MTHTYNIEFLLGLAADAGGAEDVFDSLANAAADIAEDDFGYVDADIAVSVASRELTVSVTVDDVDDDRAVHRGIGVARTILHSAGHQTAEWDRLTVQRTREPVAAR